MFGLSAPPCLRSQALRLTVEAPVALVQMEVVVPHIPVGHIWRGMHSFVGNFIIHIMHGDFDDNTSNIPRRFYGELIRAPFLLIARFPLWMEIRPKGSTLKCGLARIHVPHNIT